MVIVYRVEVSGGDSDPQSAVQVVSDLLVRSLLEQHEPLGLNVNACWR
jgi:hypothetical protein